MQKKTSSNPHLILFCFDPIWRPDYKKLSESTVTALYSIVCNRPKFSLQYYNLKWDETDDWHKLSIEVLSTVSGLGISRIICHFTQIFTFANSCIDSTIISITTNVLNSSWFRQGWTFQGLNFIGTSIHRGQFSWS